MQQTGNLSYWASSACATPECTALTGSRSTDVAVIGGGYSGLSSALHLLESGANALVLEAREIGEEASGRNNGQVIPTLKKEDPSKLIAKLGAVHGPTMAAMMAGSADYVFRLIRKYEIDCDAEQSGWLQPAHSPKHMRIVEERVTQWKQYGADAQILEREDLAKRLGSNFYIGGWFAPTGGHIQPLSYARGLAKAVIRLGGEVFTQSPALEIYRDGRRWKVRTPEGTVSAEQIIVATQASTTKALWPHLSSTVIPMTFYQLVTEPLSIAQRSRVIPGREALSDMQGDIHFIRYDSRHRLVTGGTFIYESNWKQRLEKIVHTRLQLLFPYMPRLTLSHHWKGTTALTPDFFPHLFALAPGIWSWMGCNSRGISLATRMGKVMADATQGTVGRDLPLPVETLKQVALNGLFRKLSPYALLYFRANDFWHRSTSRSSLFRLHRQKR